MKGKAKRGDLRDICGTVCCPNAVLAFFCVIIRNYEKENIKYEYLGIYAEQIS